MDRKSLLQTFRKLHKWPGVIITLFAIHFAISGIVMNHRSLLSGFDLSRKWLPKSYQYNNWNQAAVRGGFSIGKDSLLIFGNIGAWIKVNDQFIDYNKGLPHGIDNRKINQALQFKGQTVIATQFGLYKRHLIDERWSLAPTGLNDQRLVDLFIKQDTLIILTRNQLIKSADLEKFEVENLPPPEGYTKSAGLFNTLWELHSGELFGTIGKLLVDLLGIVTIALAVTGLIHFFLPNLIRNRKRTTGNSGNLPATFKLNLRWHNVVGYVFAIFLIINTTAGIFLRPPLLIPILNKKVGIIPGSHLDTSNPWHDKLRKGTWNQQLGIYIISTTDGFYAADEKLLTPMIPSYSQPPVSLMGCNVLEPIDSITYLVGSFSGLYSWNPTTGRSVDFFSNKIYQEPTGMAMPVSDHMVAGYIRDFDNNWVFDYNHGLSEKSSGKNWQMPELIKQNSPISSWNFALEIHTGRVLEPFIGILYLLYIPLAGLSVLMVLISGFMIWLLPRRKAQI